MEFRDASTDQLVKVINIAIMSQKMISAQEVKDEWLDIRSQAYAILLDRIMEVKS